MIVFDNILFQNVEELQKSNQGYIMWHVPVVIYLDHGLNYDTCIMDLEIGFSSIMYDCSKAPYDENVRKAKEMADIAHSYSATIECELGHVGDNEGSVEGDSHMADLSKFFTDPKMAKDYVDKTGVDVLLVLYGGSGLTDNDFRQAIQEGIIDLIPAAVEAIKQETMKKMQFFGNVGKAERKLAQGQKLGEEKEARIAAMVMAVRLYL